MNPLARIVYNMVAEGGDDVLRAAGRVAKKVDPRTAKEAVKRVADDVVEAADDWGWKGGKPGELTGGELMRILDETQDRIPMSKYGGANVHNAKELDKVFSQLSESKNAGVVDAIESTRTRIPNYSSPNGRRTANRVAARKVGSEFAMLENADIPREWTGKVYPVWKRLSQQNVANYPLLTPYFERLRNASSPARELANILSDTMRPMTNDQRETFLALLPEWTESLDDLANAAKML